MKFSLCPSCSSCPQVISTENYVEIGEGENLVRLKREEWNMLVDIIKKGKISKI